MKKVGNTCPTLLAPVRLKKALVEAGENERYLSRSVLFHAGDESVGVYLVCSGEVCLEVPGVPQLTRAFSADSVLGLPSTFSEKPYSLTAIATSECDVVHIDKEMFLKMMKAEPALCRQAMEILSREVTFIMSALRKRAETVSDHTFSSAAS